MIFRDKDKPMLAKLLVYASGLGVVLAGLGALGYDLYLASTQWLLVAIILAIWGVFLLLEAEFRS
ncbi:hypothetical protein A2W24_05045 [Microgenomates group bacterium RBG_16_45_19]|nr:MAG: hypothetical protein A2W24_05045 [Microgenomates group bacterium RBG_16_45_19]